ncbi:MAG: dihydroorotate dehydrogenase electron transfer subunit [Anaerolineae bacterium]
MSDGIYRVHRIVQRLDEGEVGATLVLDGVLDSEPGQFVMMWLPGVEERPLAVMNDNPLSLTIRDVGPFTHAATSLQPGDRVWVRGPYGNGFAHQSDRMLLVGGGSGIASLTLLAKRGLERGSDVRVALGARTAAQFMLDWRFVELGVPVIAATDDGSSGHRGTIVSAIESLIQAGWPGAVYACGPEPMLIALVQRLRNTPIPLYVSLERSMKCGFGVCGNCHCGDRLVCRDGPVFLADRILPALEAER